MEHLGFSQQGHTYLKSVKKKGLAKICWNAESIVEIGREKVHNIIKKKEN